MSRIGVIGAGSWGTALAVLLDNNGHDVTLWSVIEEEVEMLRTFREHKRKLPGIHLNESIKITHDLKNAIRGKELLVMAVPSKYVRTTAHSMVDYTSEEQIIVNAAKGLEDNTLFTLLQVIEDEIKSGSFAVLSGPSHAEEVARELPTTCVVGSENQSVAEKVQDIFMNKTFRVYTSTDVIGIEMGGSLKNVIALAAGISDGLGYGDNTKAALMTRGITEITRLGEAMGAKRETFNGLSGIGDLIVTCTSRHSRNRKAGLLIGKGCSLEQALEEVNMVVEGVYTAQAAIHMAKKVNVELPIIQQVNDVLFHDKEPRSAVDELMLRDKKEEHVD